MGQCMRWGGMQRAVGEGQEDAGCWVRYAMLPAEQARFRSGKTAVEAMRFADVHREQKDADGGGNRQTVCVCTRRGQAGRIAYLLLSGRRVTSEPCLKTRAWHCCAHACVWPSGLADRELAPGLSLPFAPQPAVRSPFHYLIEVNATGSPAASHNLLFTSERECLVGVKPRLSLTITAEPQCACWHHQAITVPACMASEKDRQACGGGGISHSKTTIPQPGRSPVSRLQSPARIPLRLG